ncbi:MAG: type I-D CRISPR-associated protein Cas7/Csc2 [Chloroflexi bacterium]|nr:MAG: type I-D CRISPR-associated protein Cas7/Csc2 [Phototrophicales bacterium]RMF76098.1 MAG: type I-D CRISPR-associated protein Cas7/Csc2 [Chloroflexota bacterium]
MSVLETYASNFLSQYSNYPMGRYISILLVRAVESEAIFRTEGSGEPLNKEFVHASSDPNSDVIQRVVISKRKQTAVERRTGRELLRDFDLLHNRKGDLQCTLNRNQPCEECMDCMIYGYAAGGGGAQKSRVVTDDAFSLHSARTITDQRQFNALYDTGTMRDPETGKPSTSIGTDEYVKPESIFLDIETFHDLTREEFIYAFGNILRSSRYGAVSSRIGKIRNHIAGIVFGDCELFSNLELTQTVYDSLRSDNTEPDFPIRADVVTEAVRAATDQLAGTIPGRLRILSEDEVAGLVDEVTAIYRNEGEIRAILTTASEMYGG